MTIGTRSVLFGVHAFWLHFWFVLAAWVRLFGIPLEIRVLLAIAVHDLGYWGKSDVEGPDGETHVEFGARIMGYLFGEPWASFTACHSRHYAKRINRPVSALCLADKLAFVLTPAWLYLPMARATGELSEYMLRARERQSGSARFTAEEGEQLNSADDRIWLAGLKSYTQRWVEAHLDCREDTWTVASIGSRVGSFLARKE
jgi:hypothetical protein